MLTLTQTVEIERLQKNVLKTIFGFKESYADILERCDLQTLAQRRQSLFDKFAIELADNQKHAEKWFPKQVFTGYDLRQELIF